VLSLESGLRLPEPLWLEAVRVGSILVVHKSLRLPQTKKRHEKKKKTNNTSA
jgi:hypothetical protein